MRRKTKIATGLAALAMAAVTVPLAVAAHADPGGWLCSTRDAAPVYANGDFTGYLYTVEANRGFRVHQASGTDAGWVKFYGHGADRPDRDGWVRAQHIYCP